MGSDVIRVDKDLKKEIEQLQRQIARETGEWISQSDALRRIMGK